MFRWKWMWGRIADYFGLHLAAFPPSVSALETQMADMSKSRALGFKEFKASDQAMSLMNCGRGG